MRFADVFQNGIAGALTGFNIGQAMKSGDKDQQIQSILGGLVGNQMPGMGMGMPGMGMGMPGMGLPGMGTDNQLGALGYLLGGALFGKQKNNPLFGGLAGEIIEGGAPKTEKKDDGIQQLPYPTGQRTHGIADFDGNYMPTYMDVTPEEKAKYFPPLFGGNISA